MLIKAIFSLVTEEAYQSAMNSIAMLLTIGIYCYLIFRWVLPRNYDERKNECLELSYEFMKIYYDKYPDEYEKSVNKGHDDSLISFIAGVVSYYHRKSFNLPTCWEATIEYLVKYEGMSRKTATKEIKKIIRAQQENRWEDPIDWGRFVAGNWDKNSD